MVSACWVINCRHTKLLDDEEEFSLAEQQRRSTVQRGHPVVKRGVVLAQKDNCFACGDTFGDVDKYSPSKKIKGYPYCWECGTWACSDCSRLTRGCYGGGDAEAQYVEESQPKSRGKRKQRAAKDQKSQAVGGKC